MSDLQKNLKNIYIPNDYIYAINSTLFLFSLHFASVNL